jgi:hypothetical protein
MEYTEGGQGGLNPPHKLESEAPWSNNTTPTPSLPSARGIHPLPIQTSSPSATAAHSAAPLAGLRVGVSHLCAPGRLYAVLYSQSNYTTSC